MKKNDHLSNYKKEFIVNSKDKLSLRGDSSHWHGKYESHKTALPEMENYLKKMDDLQYLMYAENKHSLLIVLQGIDGAGKDGVIRHVMSGINPQGCTVSCFKQPTDLELKHDFLWRIHRPAPSKGLVSIFNRSHYEDVLITRVHNLITKKDCLRRYDLINDFEKLLVEENGTTILKFFLHISKSEQLDRFRKRLEDPSRQWKISEGDYKERDYWETYMSAYNELLIRTSTDRAPWFIIPSDHKWFRNLAISQIITKTLEDLKMKTPLPTVDLSKIRHKYHADLVKEKSTSPRSKAQ